MSETILSTAKRRSDPETSRVPGHNVNLRFTHYRSRRTDSSIYGTMSWLVFETERNFQIFQLKKKRKCQKSCSWMPGRVGILYVRATPGLEGASHWLPDKPHSCRGGSGSKRGVNCDVLPPAQINVPRLTVYYGQSWHINSSRRKCQ